MFDEISFKTLQNRLHSLGYKESLDVRSAPLVQKLVDDLQRTKQDFLQLKQQAGTQSNEILDANDKISAVRYDVNKQQVENTQLHLRLIKEAEHRDQQEKAHYQQIKRLENTIAELSFWKKTSVDKITESQRENDMLRQKIESLIALNDKLTAGAMDPKAVAPKLVSTQDFVSTKLSPRSKPATYDALSAAHARISVLNQQLDFKTNELDQSEQRILELQEALRRRDSEISRLGTRGGVDPEVATLVARNEAHEAMILQLNHTVDVLNSQLRSQETNFVERAKVQSLLTIEAKSRADAEERLRSAVAENENIARELDRLRTDITTLHSSSSQSNALAAAEVDNALSSVAALRQRLAESRGDQERMRSLLDTVAAERNVASSQALNFQHEIEPLRSAVRELRAQAEDAKEQARASQAEASNCRDILSLKQAALLEAERQVDQLHQELDSRRVAEVRTEAERQKALARLEELQRRLEVVEEAACSDRDSNTHLSVQLGRLESELRTKVSALSTADAEIQALRGQLQDTQQARVHAQGAIGVADEERTRLQREVTLLAQRLKEERAETEKLITSKNALEYELGGLKSQIPLLTVDNADLQQRLDTTSSRLAEAQTALNSTSRELSGLQVFPTRYDELQQQVRSYIAKLATVEGEASRLRSETQRLGDSSQRAEAEVSELQKLLRSEREQVAALKLKVGELERSLEAAVVTNRTLELERDRLQSDWRSSNTELSDLRQRLHSEVQAAQEADAGSRSMQGKLSAVQRQLAAKEEETLSLKRALDQAERSVEAGRLREEEARGQGRDMAERARRAESNAQESEVELKQLRAARESDAINILRLEDSCSQLRRELDTRRHEVEQLTTLSLRGDATVQEYMANLKVMNSELRAAEMRMQDLVAELGKRDEEAHRVQLERDDLRRVVAGLDAERDNLQAELDQKAEQLAALTSELDLKIKQLGEVTRLLTMAEGRLAHSDSRAHENDVEASSLRDQLAGAMDGLRGLSSEHEKLRAELRAAHEDLEALVRENQAVGNELTTVSRQRDHANAELRHLSPRLVAAEQLVRAKEAEVEDLRRAYESLALEHRRVESTAAQLEREATMREATLGARGDEVASLHEALREAHSQNNQYVMDLQAFERQIDALSRQLAKAEADMEDLIRERESMLEEMRASQQVRLSSERQREELQRQVAALDSQLAITHARLEDAGNESSSLTQRLVLERSRIAELEAVLAAQRAREYRQDLSSTKSGSQLAIMQERNRILEEQVSALHHQMQELQHSREAQDRELGRLRTEAMALIASTTSLEQQGQESVARLGQRADAAEMKAQEMGSALRNMKMERDSLSSRLEALSLQAQADVTALKQQMDVAMDGRSALSRELAAAKQQVEELRRAAAAAGMSKHESEAAESSAPVFLAEVSRLRTQVTDLSLENERLRKEMSVASQQSSLQAVHPRELNTVHIQQLMRVQVQLKLDAAANEGSSTAQGNLMQQLMRVQVQLKEEQMKRRQAERDFLDLMESIEQTDSGQSDHVAKGVSTQKLKDMQAKLNALEAEKLSLEDNVNKTRALMHAMQVELSRIHQEYGSASGTLQQLAHDLQEVQTGHAVHNEVSDTSDGDSSALRGTTSMVSSQVGSVSTIQEETWGSSGGGGGGGQRP
ncbi:hypothetical protein CEUSTIGMA_g448.t1 [Chlamydomonas eustigma]|uniref:Centrosomal protein of 135 kDa n=1 Tax=Chlamydomonas eustigma TaxID=1157962 RepID=A0A250WQM2_9CHLO|nr:hypothetical protein CEUSTIGMA_g448.t1 [Chlamydomonas eustigma]|eukprot:GAX72996.1 hypothetical protein CEUSTIGMA_g448.t1 [Chlamydomonas eustigma]